MKLEQRYLAGAIASIACCRTWSFGLTELEWAPSAINRQNTQRNKNGFTSPRHDRRAPSGASFALGMSAYMEDPTSSQPTMLEDAFTASSQVIENEVVIGLATERKAMGVLHGSRLAGLVLACLSLATLHSTVWHGWTNAEILERLSADTWGLYSSALHDSPIVTKACTSATVYTIGDVLAQRSEGRDELDKVRMLRSMAAGGIGHGPLSHCWYNVCDGFFNDVLHWTAWWALFPKIMVDQLVWGPCWNGTYIAMLGIMKREDPRNIFADVRRSTIPLLVAGLKLWPAAHVITYGLIPVENRLLWVDFVEIAWVTILASQASAIDESKVDTENLDVQAAA